MGKKTRLVLLEPPILLDSAMMIPNQSPAAIQTFKTSFCD
jgi:hypothetical protein